MADAVWAILDNYCYEPIEIIRETPKTVFYKSWNWDMTGWRERRTSTVMDWRGSEADAKRVSKDLNAARKEMEERRRDAARRFRELRSIILASGIETRSDETSQKARPEG